MDDMKPMMQTKTQAGSNAIQDKWKLGDLPLWETPKLEDVSEQVMAQPYIRFT